MTWYEKARWTEHASDTALSNIINRANRDDRGDSVRIPWPLMLGILSRLADAEGRDGAA